MGRKVLYREYGENGDLIKLECSKCREIKTVDNFSKDKTNKDGIKTICKKCKVEYSRKYREEHKEERLTYERKYNEEHKEERREYTRKYDLEHRKEKSEYGCEYHKKHKEERNKYNKLYREEHKEEIKKYKSKYYKQYHEEHKDKLGKYMKQYYYNNTQKEVIKIYENVTKNLYLHEGIQYGIIYGVHCKVTDRWYIGQSINSFSQRYHNNFFNCKNRELSKDSIKAHLLQDDIEKYGQENFEIFEVLDVAFSEKELDEKEVYYIDYYKAYDEGYNSNRGNIFKHNKSKRKEVI